MKGHLTLLIIPIKLRQTPLNFDYPKKIASALEREAISENSIKYHLAIMKDHNLVGAKTGYGTYITESGMRFYQTHSNNAL